ncbi:odorant receptor Or2 [Diachasma alloeum]|uniref:Odorant receptor n=1 Tax=Diachasma alloeum TaxID=454923 RepID=A0A4E0RK88_9HYME|nr:odorant receptor Or2 [Diachasma alloeum]THK33182.1 odorant receptor 87 [Diachasma alloeum]
MTSTKRGKLPMKVTYFFLSCVGFGVAETEYDRKLLNISLCAFLLLSTASIYFTATNFYLKLNRGIISETIEASFPLLTSSLTHFKLVLFTLQRTPYEHLLQRTNETLWIQSSTEYGEIVLEKCERQAQLFLFIFVILGHASGVGWIFEPLFLNMRSNSSTRHLPTEVIIGVPLFESPNYEIFFAVNALGIYIITILYFCFDFYLVLVNIFIVGQFEILRQRFEIIYSVKPNQSVIKNGHDNGKNNHRQLATMDYISQEFKNCAKQHQFLISLMEEIESIHNMMNLAQVLMISLIICLVGYPLLMPGSALTIVKNGVFICSCLIQLFTYTLSCHNIMIASSDIADGIYFSRWYHENHTEAGRSLSKAFMIVLLKTQCPCYLTAWGFFPITLDTLKSILTTAFSYLTLMRQSMEQ